MAASASSIAFWAKYSESLLGRPEQEEIQTTGVDYTSRVSEFFEFQDREMEKENAIRDNSVMVLQRFFRCSYVRSSVLLPSKVECRLKEIFSADILEIKCKNEYFELIELMFEKM